MSVDLETMAPMPTVGGLGSHGGYCGRAIKPIALYMISELANDPAMKGLPISGIGGVESWRDAVEFLALGAGNIQVCTAAMVYGFKVVQDMVTGLESFMDTRGTARVADLVGLAAPKVTQWENLDLDYTVKAQIDQSLCIQCGKCHVVCEDTSHQAITSMVDGVRHFEVIESECVGCNLCPSVCPVQNCITLVQLPNGALDPRTGEQVGGGRTWKEHPNNPHSEMAK
jgi:dihydropyrimidine dehydrogenase (NAD+) subunit PreA